MNRPNRLSNERSPLDVSSFFFLFPSRLPLPTTRPPSPKTQTNFFAPPSPTTSVSTNDGKLHLQLVRVTSRVSSSLTFRADRPSFPSARFLSGAFEPPGSKAVAEFVQQHERETDPRWIAVRIAEERAKAAGGAGGGGGELYSTRFLRLPCFLAAVELISFFFVFSGRDDDRAA